MPLREKNLFTEFDLLYSERVYFKGLDANIFYHP